MPRAIYIWDLPVRLFHWLLAITICGAFVSGKYGGLWLDYHTLIGVFIIALIAFRFAWGFTGSNYARFSGFMPTPTRFRAYFSADKTYAGHSPHGAIAIFALLLAVCLQACLGMFASNDEIDTHGPLYDLVSTSCSDRLTGWHARFADFLALLIAAHLVAITYYTLVKRKSLVRPMLTGNISVHENIKIEPASHAGSMAFLFSISIAGIVFWAIQSGTLFRLLTHLSAAYTHETTIPAT